MYIFSSFGQNIFRLKEENQVQIKNKILKNFLLRRMASLLGQEGTFWGPVRASAEKN